MYAKLKTSLSVAALLAFSAAALIALSAVASADETSREVVAAVAKSTP